LYFLALPDYLGYESALAMAPRRKEEVLRALRLMQLGNKLITTIGGREMHPFRMAVGGVTKLPEKKELQELAKQLRTALKDAEATAELFLKLKLPRFERKTQYVSLKKSQSYALMDGQLFCEDYEFEGRDYKDHLSEFENLYSSAKLVTLHEKPYMTGALARINNNHEQLNKKAKKWLKKANKKPPFTNPFLNNFCQAVELVHFIERSIDVLSNLELKEEPQNQYAPRAEKGVGVVEVPRGLLFHEYQLDSQGTILKANIVTPTVQNLKNIEEDIKALVPSLLKKPKKKIILEIEKLIRSYDPCFSCSAHFLEVKWL
jgi:coenzyme F420-reducing hydrogenase alpha subunit